MILKVWVSTAVNWLGWNPQRIDYVEHFWRWGVAFLPGFIALLVTVSVQVTDPIAYAASLLVIVAACLLAAWIPAARAAGLDPMRTIRQE